MPLRQSVCVPMMKPGDMAYDEFFDAVREIGFPAVEFWSRDGLVDAGGVFERARSKGLVIASMIGHASIEAGLNDPAEHDRIEAEIRDSVDAAVRFGIPGLVIFSGNRREGQSDAEGLRVAAEGARRIAPYAEEKGVNLNLELLNSRVDHPGYLADRTDWGVAFCEAVGSPRVKLLFDIYHMQIMEGDLVRTIRARAGRIGHFHTAGNPGRGPLAGGQELHYGGICRAIAATGYAGFVGHEFQAETGILDHLRDAFRLCNGE